MQKNKNILNFKSHTHRGKGSWYSNPHIVQGSTVYTIFKIHCLIEVYIIGELSYSKHTYTCNTLF